MSSTENMTLHVINTESQGIREMKGGTAMGRQPKLETYLVEEIMDTQSRLLNLPPHYLHNPKTKWTMQQLCKINKYLEKDQIKGLEFKSRSLFEEEQKCLGGRN